jgi:hypothetical protein
MSSISTWKSAVATVVKQLKTSDKLRDTTVLLVGSVARRANTPTSDIDVLLIGPRRLPQVVTPPGVQVFTMTRDQFIERLRAGDDFPHWALRYGKVLADDSQWWNRALDDAAAKAWPSWQRKLDQAAQRLSFAVRLASAKDYEHAQEEYLLATRHFARALLLWNKVFPLSQPELPGQLRKLGRREVADVLDSLVKDSVHPQTLGKVERLLREWTNELGREANVPDVGARRVS